MKLFFFEGIQDETFRNKLSRSQGNYRMKLPGLRIHHPSMNWKDHMKKYKRKKKWKTKRDTPSPGLDGLKSSATRSFPKPLQMFLISGIQV